MSVNENAAELLEKAADGFESGRYGWIRYQSQLIDLRTGQISYCATGALHYEAGLRNPNAYSMCNAPTLLSYQHANKALEQVVEFPVGGVPSWNDYEAADMTEVVNKMKEAAKQLRNGELT